MDPSPQTVLEGTRMLEVPRSFPCIPFILCLIVISLLGHGLNNHGPSSIDHHTFAINTAVPTLRGYELPVDAGEVIQLLVSNIRP